MIALHSNMKGEDIIEHTNDKVLCVHISVMQEEDSWTS